MGQITRGIGGVIAAYFKALVIIFSVTFVLTGQEGDVRFPATVTTVEGEQIDVARLAAKKKVVVVTVKAASCPVCRIQLQRLKYHINQFRRCNVTFLVLIPGPKNDILTFREDTEFPYPFVEDRNFTIATSLSLRMSENEIFPTILVLNKDLTVRWQKRGRNVLYYGDPELLEELKCTNWI